MPLPLIYIFHPYIRYIYNYYIVHINAVLYVKGLSYSHYSAYHTLENIRISLQQRLEKQPLGNIRNLGNGRIKNVFTDDIDNIEG